MYLQFVSILEIYLLNPTYILILQKYFIETSTNMMFIFEKEI
jgi:hypothetical protein